MYSVMFTNLLSNTSIFKDYELIIVIVLQLKLHNYAPA